MINGIQLGVYMPLTNVPIPENASEFTQFVAGVVTFDIPEVDMESVFGSIVECPEDDDILTELDEERLSESSTVGGVQWSEIKINYFQQPNFDRKSLFNALDETDQQLLIRLAEAQEDQGWSNLLYNPESSTKPYVEALDTVGFDSAYLSRNLGTAFVFILFATMGLVTILFTLLF